MTQHKRENRLETKFWKPKTKISPKFHNDTWLSSPKNTALNYWTTVHYVDIVASKTFLELCYVVETLMVNGLYLYSAFLV